VGLYIHSLENIPEAVDRDYFVYLLDYGWDEPLGEALMRNYAMMASIAAKNRAVVIKGTEAHFQDEVFSWHNINGEDAEEMLPAILITNRHPEEFRRRHAHGDGQHVEKELRMILIPLRKFCKTTTDVVVIINRIFEDIHNKKDLKEFRIAKEIKHVE
jgi:hypothetical protein